MEQECGEREKEERAVAVEAEVVRSEAGEEAAAALLPKRNRARAEARAADCDVRKSSENTIRESSGEASCQSPHPGGRVSEVT